MEVKEVAKIAINYIADVFSEENLTNIGLEEIIYNKKGWNVTVGFSRPWDYQSPNMVIGLHKKQPTRQYKIIEINDENGKVNAIKIRE